MEGREHPCQTWQNAVMFVPSRVIARRDQKADVNTRRAQINRLAELRARMNSGVVVMKDHFSPKAWEGTYRRICKEIVLHQA